MIYLIEVDHQVQYNGRASPAIKKPTVLGDM